MIKQTRKPIQLTKSMLINILRGMEIKYLIDLPQQNYHILPSRVNPI